MAGLHLDRKPGCKCARCEDAKRAGFRARPLTEFGELLHSLRPLGTNDLGIRVVARCKGDRVLSKRYERFVPDPTDPRPGSGRWVPLRRRAAR